MKKLAISVPSFLLLVAAVTCVPMCFPQQQNPQNANREETKEDDVVRISTTLVTVTLNVKDHHGKIVPNLEQKDFHLFEDGVEQEIAYFDPGSEVKRTVSQSTLPLTVALLLDVSDSTEFKLNQIQQAAIAFIDQLQPDDRILVVAFDKRVQVLAEATKDRTVLREAIGRTQTGGGTSLYSAIDIAINNRLRNISGRKAIVLFTDGVDTGSAGATFDSTVSAAEKSDAVIYPVQFNTYGDFADSPSRQTSAGGGATTTSHATKNGELASEAYKRGTNYLRLLAEKTGGMMQYSDGIKYLSRSFTRIASQLRQQYTLGYYPRNRAVNGRQRQIKVRVGLPEVVVSTRKSYVYAPQH
jgi:Ca-activated chloride channel homolog